MKRSDNYCTQSNESESAVMLIKQQTEKIEIQSSDGEIEIMNTTSQIPMNGNNENQLSNRLLK